MRRQEHMACRVALCPFQVISSRGCEPLELCKFWNVVQEREKGEILSNFL